MGNGVNDRRTPRELFDRLNTELNFTLDGAASHENALVGTYCTLDGVFFKCFNQGCIYGDHKLSPTDGLTTPWNGHRVFINPPYGRGLLEPFVKKAASGEADIAVALIPVRTEQPWFHDYVWCEDLHRPYDGVEIRFLKGRVKYDGLGAAPFPSMVVVWRSA